MNIRRKQPNRSTGTITDRHCRRELAFFSTVCSSGEQARRWRIGSLCEPVALFPKEVEESLDVAGLKLVNVEGQSFDPGMAASALNIGDFGPDDTLLVDQMVEPIIMGPDGLKKQGTVMLRKVCA